MTNQKNNYLVTTSIVFFCGVLMQATVRGQNYNNVGEQLVNKQRWVTLEVGPGRLVAFGAPMVGGGGNPEKRLRALIQGQLQPLSDKGVLQKKENYRVSLIKGEPTVWVPNPQRVAGLPPQKRAGDC